MIPIIYKSIAVILFIFSVAWLTSCTKRTGTTIGEIDNSAIIELPIIPSQDHIQFDKVFAGVNMIKLETCADCLIGHVDKIVFDEDKIFIADKSQSEAVFIFDKTGKYLGRVSNKGKAPNEYIGIRDFSVDKTRKELILLDLDARKLKYFDYEGKFLKSRDITFLFSEYEMIGTEFNAYHLSLAYNDLYPVVDQHYFCTSDSTGRSINAYFPFDVNAREFSYVHADQLKVFDDSVYYYPRFTDTIYQVMADELVGKYTFAYKSTGVPSRLRGNMTDNAFINDISKRYNLFHGDYVITEDFLFYTIGYPQKSMPLIHSKYTGKTAAIEGMEFTKPFSVFLAQPIAVLPDNKVIVVKQAHELAGYRVILEDMPSLMQAQLDELEILKNIEPSDNPLLFIYEIGNF